MSFGYWKPYVPVAKRRAAAKKAIAKAAKSGNAMQPVALTGRTIAATFWGKAWCDNLEAYSDFESRMPRGRTYVRNGSVIDLKIEPGKVQALVMGSSLYKVEINITALQKQRWTHLTKQCTGSIASLVELLQGKFSKGVMAHICQQKTGLFPAPKDIVLDCTCPDWADMCKHVAAVLYGVGARLDAQPELLFALRQVDAGDLVTQAVATPASAKKKTTSARVLDDTELGDVFGIEMAPKSPAPAAKKKPAASRSRAPQTPAAPVTASAKTRKKTTVAAPTTPATPKPKATTTRKKKTTPTATATAASTKTRSKKTVIASAKTKRTATKKPASKKKSATAAAKPTSRKKPNV